MMRPASPAVAVAFAASCSRRAYTSELNRTASTLTPEGGWQDDDMPPPLLLLDGASMWFRAFYGVPSSITSPDGRPVNAMRGFLDTVATLVTRERPGRLGGCLDLDWRAPIP